MDLINQHIITDFGSGLKTLSPIYGTAHKAFATGNVSVDQDKNRVHVTFVADPMQYGLQSQSVYTKTLSDDGKFGAYERVQGGSTSKPTGIIYFKEQKNGDKWVVLAVDDWNQKILFRGVEIPRPAGPLIKSATGNEKILVVIDEANNIYERPADGTGSWAQIPGKASQLILESGQVSNPSLGDISYTNIWAITPDGNLKVTSRIDNDVTNKPELSAWTPMSSINVSTPSSKMIRISPQREVFLLTKDNRIVKWTNNGWVPLDLLGVNILSFDAGSDALWFSDYFGNLFYYSLSAGKLSPKVYRFNGAEWTPFLPFGAFVSFASTSDRFSYMGRCNIIKDNNINTTFAHVEKKYVRRIPLQTVDSPNLETYKSITWQILPVEEKDWQPEIPFSPWRMGGTIRYGQPVVLRSAHTGINLTNANFAIRSGMEGVRNTQVNLRDTTGAQDQQFSFVGSKPAGSPVLIGDKFWIVSSYGNVVNDVAAANILLYGWELEGCQGKGRNLIVGSNPGTNTDMQWKLLDHPFALSIKNQVLRTVEQGQKDSTFTTNEKQCPTISSLYAQQKGFSWQ